MIAFKYQGPIDSLSDSLRCLILAICTTIPVKQEVCNYMSLGVDGTYSKYCCFMHITRKDVQIAVRSNFNISDPT